jgi:hypothetical protein
MTSHTGRLYALALALVVFFVAWAAVAAHPWAKAAPDPRLQALAAREARLRQEAKLVNRVVADRWAAYRSALRLRKAQITEAKARIAATQAAARTTVSAAQAAAPAVSSAPSVRVVTLPPLTVTRTS